MKTKLVKLGKHGEALAKKYLLNKGYEIVKENFRFERAETDIIAKDDAKKLLVFVEVKTRRNKKFGEPEEAVTEQKMRQLVKSAEGFLMNSQGYEDYDRRFDIIAILTDGQKETINHIENAI